MTHLTPRAFTALSRAFDRELTQDFVPCGSFFPWQALQEVERGTDMRLCSLAGELPSVCVAGLSLSTLACLASVRTSLAISPAKTDTDIR